MHNITKRTLLGSVSLAALGSLAMGVPAQGSDSKPVPKPVTKVDTSVLAKEAAARVTTPANARVAQQHVQAAIASYVAKHGTKYSFGSYLDAKTGAVVVLSDAPAAVLSKLTDTSGDRAAAGATVRTSTSTITDQWNRKDDVAPFYGGGGIAATGGICSSGYAVNYGTARYMVTAGHCFANGTLVKTESGANDYGYVAWRRLASLGHGPKDMEIIYNKSYSPRIFTGGLWSTSSAAVVGAGDAVQGYTNYCHSGRTTGENCGHTAVDVNAQVCTQTGCKSPVVAFNGGTLSQGGDSGSPFYVKSGTQAWIRGHVIAGNGGTMSWAEKWGKVASTYGVTIATS